MARPFHLPSDEETENHYRRLDQLLLDLYHVLRQILFRAPFRRAEVEPAPSGSRRLPYVSCPCRQVRRGRQRGRRRQQACTAARPAPLPDLVPWPTEHWLAIDEHLREITEEFKTTFKKQEDRKEVKDLKLKVRTSGVFSLLVPAQYHSSIWTTVLLLVGWRLLLRSR